MIFGPDGVGEVPSANRSSHSDMRRVRVRQEKNSYIELPSLDVLARVFVGNYDDKLGYLAADHPFV